MKYTNILFDLDGTLTDPGLGIKNSIRYALDKRGLSSLPEEVLDCFIGPPLVDSFEQYCHVSRQEAEVLLRTYREYFSVTGLFENRVYDGIPQLLERLSDKGYRLCLTTSKPEIFATQILEHFDLSRYFTYIGGSTMDGSRVEKEDVIAYVMERLELSPEDTVMVGDRIYDVRGGAACGLATVGVLYGYGDAGELSGADWLVETPAQLERLFAEEL